MAYLNSTRTATEVLQNAYDATYDTFGLTVGRSAFLYAEYGYGIHAPIYGFQLRLSGQVIGRYGAIWVEQPADNFTSLPSGTRLVILESGYADGGMYVSATGSTIENHGTIVERINFSGKSVHTLENHGTITAQNYAIASSVDSFVLRNTGLISSENIAYSGSETVTEIRNTGTIRGDVYLLGGNDFLDNRGGRIDGTIDGGAGNDVFRPGAGEETIIGGSGRDAIDFRHSGAVTVDLYYADRNRGNAAGDSYTGIEEIYGSFTADDRLYGDGYANDLYGRGGADRLDGRRGNDLIFGGLDADRLTGGGGNDRFAYQSTDDFGDRIDDFGNTSGNDDRFEFLNTEFTGTEATGRIASSAFRSDKDNVARDADDRFIFRTTDRTLWFDEDGKGGDSAEMVADLANNATLTYRDITLVSYDTLF